MMNDIDIQAEREGKAEQAYRAGYVHSYDFGHRKRSMAQTQNNAARNGTLPERGLTRKRKRAKCTRQINLASVRLHERLNNPTLYKKYHKLILEKQKMTMVKRKIDGKDVELTPVQNFKHTAGSRLGRAKYAIGLIANCTGQGYEHTDEQIDKIESVLLDAVTQALEALRAPTSETGNKAPKHFVKL